VNTQQNKNRRAAAFNRWLARRQSPKVLDRMAQRWAARHPVDTSKKVITVTRYRTAMAVNPKHEVK